MIKNTITINSCPLCSCKMSSKIISNNKNLYIYILFKLISKNNHNLTMSKNEILCLFHYEVYKDDNLCISLLLVIYILIILILFLYYRRLYFCRVYYNQV